MPKLAGKDVVSLVVVICATILILSGKDSIVGFTLLGVVCGYYGIDLAPFIKIGRNQGGK